MSTTTHAATVVVDLPDGGTMNTYPNGHVVYRNASGKWHREDGPAVVRPDGSEQWCLNGELHRVGGPAVTYSNGTMYWFRHGKIHREDGPAFIGYDGRKNWHLFEELIVYLFDSRVYLSNSYEISADLIADVMQHNGIDELEEFCDWLALTVLGQEVVELRHQGVAWSDITTAIVSFLSNLEEFDGLPLSWWYPIIKMEVRNPKPER